MKDQRRVGVVKHCILIGHVTLVFVLPDHRRPGVVIVLLCLQFLGVMGLWGYSSITTSIVQWVFSYNRTAILAFRISDNDCPTRFETDDSAELYSMFVTTSYPKTQRYKVWVQSAISTA